jgi:PAS domain S-box-containing protein
VNGAPKLKSGRAENDLRASEARYRRLFETAKDGILILDAQSGLITDVNPFLTALLDYAREDFLGKSLWDIGAFKQIQESRAAFRELQNKQYIRYENLPLETRSGRRVNVEFISNVYEENGKSVIQCNIRDITARRQGEALLHESQQRLAGIISCAMDSIIIVDEQQRVVVFNTAAQKMFGCSEAQAVGQSIERFIPQRFHAAHSSHIRAFEETSITNRYMGALEPTSAVRADGEEFEIEASISQTESNGKKIFTVIVRDISEKRRAEDTQRESERNYRSLFDNMLNALACLRVHFDQGRAVDFTYLNVNGAFETQTGLKNVVGKRMSELFPGLLKSDPELFERYGRVARTGVPEQFEIYVNAIRNWHSESVYRWQNECVVVAFDVITERRQSEDALRRSEERFSKAFRNNPLALTISTEAEERYLDVNEAFLDVLGYQRKDVIGRTAAELDFWAEPLDRGEMKRQLNEEDLVSKRQMRYRTAKGKIREAEVWAESLELEGQCCVLTIIRDVTEMMQLEAQLRQAQKMEAVGRLAGGIAHDFNNMLGIIMGYSDLSLDLIEPDNPVNRYVLETKKTAKRAALLTRQLLAFSRKQVSFPRIFDLNEVVRNATEMFLRLVGEDVTVEFRPAAPLCAIKADPGQIELVLMNLVVNARDAMPTGGKIVIQTGHAELDEDNVSLHRGAHVGDSVVLAISDNGCGMDEIIQSQIFEPFFTTKGVGRGTGLGLSTVYGIVKQSEGNILVYSEPGKGTTFKIYFPRVGEKAETLVLSQDEIEPRGQSETILVVEDDETLRKVTVKLLLNGGYQVIEAKDAKDAIRIMATSEAGIDLLLTDVIMPDKSGPELVKQVEGAHPKTRFVFMSGYSDDMVRRHGLLMQEDSFLEKPFTKRSLLVKIYFALHRDSEKQPDI